MPERSLGLKENIFSWPGELITEITFHDNISLNFISSTFLAGAYHVL